MDCNIIHFSRHAIRRMFERGIETDAVLAIVKSGEVILDYPDDTPFPSALLLGWDNNLPLHVLVAKEPQTEDCVIVTCYSPDRESWSTDYRKRKKP